MAMAYLLLILLILGKAVFKSKLRRQSVVNETKGIIRTPVIDLSDGLDIAPSFLKPKKLLLVAVLTLFVIELLNIAFILFIEVPSGDQPSQLSNTIAIAASAVSILFPVALLIIDNDWTDGLVNVTKSQTLLSYSLALPLCLALLVCFARYSFSLHPQTGAWLAVGSVGIAAGVFYRLVMIVLYPSIRKKTEERVVKDQVFRSIRRSAEERAGASTTKKYFEVNNVAGIEFSPYTYLETNYRKWFQVKADRAGILTEIDMNKIHSIFQKTLTSITPKGATSNIALIEKSTETKKVTLKINLILSVGKEIEIGDTVVDFVIPNDSEFTDSISVKSVIKEVLTAFTISSSEDQGLIIEQFEEFSSHLKLLALKAVKEDDITQLPTLERYLAAWLEALNDAFRSLKVKYDLKNASNEQSYYLFGSNAAWVPLTEITSIINEVGVRALKSDSSDRPEFAKGLIDLTESLFRKMAHHGEILSSNQLLWQIYRLADFSIRTNHKASDWLVEDIISGIEYFTKYYISPKLEKIDPPEDEEKNS
jgi:hypothetical protein